MHSEIGTIPRYELQFSVNLLQAQSNWFLSNDPKFKWIKQNEPAVNDGFRLLVERTSK